jgi:hypothetical protein
MARLAAFGQGNQFSAFGAAILAAFPFEFRARTVDHRIES